jgi:hypothetical protein
MLADMNKENAEFIMAMKTICATLDSGAKVIPKTKAVAKGNKVGDEEPGMEEQPAEEASEEPVEEK